MDSFLNGMMRRRLAEPSMGWRPTGVQRSPSRGRAQTVPAAPKSVLPDQPCRPAMGYASHEDVDMLMFHCKRARSTLSSSTWICGTRRFTSAQRALHFPGTWFLQPVRARCSFDASHRPCRTGSSTFLPADGVGVSRGSLTKCTKARFVNCYCAI